MTTVTKREAGFLLLALSPFTMHSCIFYTSLRLFGCLTKNTEYHFHNSESKKIPSQRYNFLFGRIYLHHTSTFVMFSGLCCCDRMKMRKTVGSESKVNEPIWTQIIVSSDGTMLLFPYFFLLWFQCFICVCLCFARRKLGKY